MTSGAWCRITAMRIQEGFLCAAAVAAGVVTSGTPLLAADDPPPGLDAGAAAAYSIDTSATTAAVALGGKGNFALAIRPAPGWHIKSETPLSVALSSSGLKLDKAKLGWPDSASKDPEAGPSFTVRFSAQDAGDREIAADATFFVCNPKICQRAHRTLKVKVRVSK